MENKDDFIKQMTTLLELIFNRVNDSLTTKEKIPEEACLAIQYLTSLNDVVKQNIGEKTFYSPSFEVLKKIPENDFDQHLYETALLYKKTIKGIFILNACYLVGASYLENIQDLMEEKDSSEENSRFSAIEFTKREAA